MGKSVHDFVLKKRRERNPGKCCETFTLVGNVSMYDDGTVEGGMSSDRLTFTCDLPLGHEGKHKCSKRYIEEIIVDTLDQKSVKYPFIKEFTFEWVDESEEAMNKRYDHIYDIENKKWIKERYEIKNKTEDIIDIWDNKRDIPVVSFCADNIKYDFNIKEDIEKYCRKLNNLLGD